MSRLGTDERGVTIVELLMVLVLVGLIMGASLTTLAQFERTSATNQRQNAAQDQARRGIAGLARELRNLASPTDELPQAVVRSTGTELVFQSVSGTALRRVRYCLNATQERLWRQVQFAPFSTPSESVCPDAAWGTVARVTAEDVVNGSRPVFAANAADPTAITEIGSTLWVDVDPDARPSETSLQTSVFLRNQNRIPTADFTATISGSSIVLNGSESNDPEGKALDYYWYDAAQAGNLCGTLPSEVPQTGCVGAGIVFSYTPPAAGARTVTLVVRDQAGLTDEADDQSVCVSGPGVPC